MRWWTMLEMFGVDEVITDALVDDVRNVRS